MSKLSTTTALALVTSTELKAKDRDLQQLQQTVVTQLAFMRDMRRQEALRGLFVGLALQRIKASLPYGQFGKWVNTNIAEYGERYVNYLMKLALVFIDKCNVRKPEILALPGDQTEFALDTLKGDERRFVEKAEKFTGDLSLTELFIKYDIKSVGLKKELTAGKDDDAPPAKTPQELCMELLEHLTLTRKDTCDHAVWMQMSKAQHDDLKAAFEDAAEQVAALHAKTHGRAARANRKP